MLRDYWSIKDSDEEWIILPFQLLYGLFFTDFVLTLSIFFSLIVCCLWLCCKPRREEVNGSLALPGLSVISFL
jgi:hypothetical protein